MSKPMAPMLICYHFIDVLYFATSAQKAVFGSFGN